MSDTSSDHRFAAKLGQLLGGLVGGVAIGAAQYGLVRTGMAHGRSTNGLAGIGVAARYGLGTIGLSVVLIGLLFLVLRARLWALAAAVALLLEGFVLLVTWNHLGAIGLHGDHRAVVLLGLPALVVLVVLARWPVRQRKGIDSQMPVRRSQTGT